MSTAVRIPRAWLPSSPSSPTWPSVAATSAPTSATKPWPAASGRISMAWFCCCGARTRAARTSGSCWMTTTCRTWGPSSGRAAASSMHCWLRHFRRICWRGVTPPTKMWMRCWTPWTCWNPVVWHPKMRCSSRSMASKDLRRNWLNCWKPSRVKNLNKWSKAANTLLRGSKRPGKLKSVSKF